MSHIALLRSLETFSGFSASEIDALERALVVQEYPDGHEFVREGHPADSLYIVVAGDVAITRRAQTDPRSHIEITRLRPGEMFGLLALIDRGKRAATCTAVGPVCAASLRREAFELLYDANAPIALHFQQIVSRQLMRDFRALINRMRQSIFGADDERALERLEPIISRYAGPERRRAERRTGGN